MAMTETEQKWIDHAKYDLETARAMLDSSRYLYVLFCCQQAIEKALKCLILQQTGETPPRIHNLLQLAKGAGIEFNTGHIRFFRELSAFYVKTRYPEEIQAMGSTITRELAGETLKKTEEIIKWLFSILK